MLWKGLRTVLLGGSLLALAACGGEESGAGMAEGEGAEAPPVSTAREGAEEPGTSARSAECLDLVEAGEFERALSVCAEAAKAAPQNREVQEALSEARQQAGEAASSARESAEDAADQLGEAGEGMP